MIENVHTCDCFREFVSGNEKRKKIRTKSGISQQMPGVLNIEVKKTLIIQYLIYLPEEYENNKKEYPLILFLHSSQEKGNNLDLVRKCGLPKILEKKDNFPFVVISPQCSKDEVIGWNTESLIYLLDEILMKYRIDKSKVYLTGMSMGGRGVWSLAIEHPERFSAIAPVCGYGIPFLTGRLKGMPVWIFHGAKDEIVPLQNSDDMVKALKRNGAEVKQTIYPESGHEVWDETYNNPKLYKWFLQNSR
ncbi:MAG: prolyl oligopeptidase family serine peptidase [Mariniphaga sp.]|nr:prolyl oligopeptidase family serine peptidase [Mariniphaga sp.]MDD4226976.1 prolyl oligopeptidase family serine peptidase [Mariniphaga sp.]